MKRVVECPSCHTKLQIFDMGKTINQKCPRCKNQFVIEPEGKEKKSPETVSVKEESKEAVPKKEALAKETAAKEVSEKKDTKANGTKKKIMVKPPAKNLKKTVAKTANKATEKVEPGKPATTEKSSGLMKKPVAPAAPELMPTPAPAQEPPLAGFSGLQFISLAVLLIVVIIMQFMNLKKSTALANNQKLIFEKVK